MFEQKYEKYHSFLSENLKFLEEKFSIYLTRHVFVMNCPFGSGEKVQNRFSTWLLGQPSWISDQNDFSYLFSNKSTPILPNEFLVTGPFYSGEVQNR